MSDLTDFKAGELPSNDNRRNPNAEEDRPVHADVASDGSEEGEIKDDYPVSTEQKGKSKDHHDVDSKRKRSPSMTEQERPKRYKGGKLSFTKPAYPGRNIPCMMRVNERDTLGSMYPSEDGFAVSLFLDPCRYGAPKAGLFFRTTGSGKGKDIARIFWDTDSRLGGEWSMSHIEHGYTTLTGANSTSSNPTVLMSCNPKHSQRLMYFRFESAAFTQGFYKAALLDGQVQAIEQATNTLFRPKKAYLMEVWFLPPMKAGAFRENCLAHFTASEANRSGPLDHWQDDKGRYFSQVPKLPLPKSLISSVFSVPVPLARLVKPATQQAGSTQDTVAGGGTPDNSIGETMEDTNVSESLPPPTLTFLKEAPSESTWEPSMAGLDDIDFDEESESESDPEAESV